jgi:hypothetical protein
MRKCLWILLVPIVALLPPLCAPARGQGPIQPQVLYARQRQINIPFDPDPAEVHRLKQLQLYYSTDSGRSWHLGATAAPDQKRFNFIAEGDGLYWFAVQTTDLQNRNYPDKREGLAAALRVVFDSVPPVVNLKALPPRGNEVGVTWDVRDDNFDGNQAGAIKLDYRPVGATAWTPLFRPAGAGTQYWAPGTTGLVEVRIRATDLAGNSTEATTQVSLNQGGFGNAGGDNRDTTSSVGPAADVERRYLNSKRITLNYEITEKGPSDISGIDLWFTRDGRSWSKFQLAKNAAKDAAFNGPLTFDVDAEGVYGFTLLPKSGVGLSQAPPQVGEKPQVWIEVDLTKPVVELQSVLVGQGEHKGKLSITWLARDKNLGKTPITLSYAMASTGPWTTFTNQLANTGRYIWTMPTDNSFPWQFYIKVEAVDLAGNIGEAITPGLVKVDLQLPKAKITSVQPGL